MNAKMSELKRCFEAAGFKDVVTVLASGNVVFDAHAASPSAIERKIEASMEKTQGRTFYTLVRSVEALEALIAAEPFAKFKLPAAAKRVVTFLREPPARPTRLPIKFDGAQILAVEGHEVFTAYVPSPGNPAFMTLIEKTFGKNVTTRTWDTVQKCAKA
jgi:uncharacterized protein (DUF1697 family)